MDDLIKRLPGETVSNKKNVSSMLDSFDSVNEWQTFLFGKVDHMADFEKAISSHKKQVEYLALLGMVHPAILSLRSYYELSLSWVYYYDHPREWLAVKDGRMYIKTPGKVRDEIFSLYSDARERGKVLGRNNNNFHSAYGKLSEYAHSASPYSLPEIKTADDLVRTKSEVANLLRLVKASNSDIWDWYAIVLGREKWLRLPESIKDKISENAIEAETGDKLYFFTG